MAGTKTFNLKALITAVDKLSPVLRGINKNIAVWERRMKSASKGAIPMGLAFAGGIGMATKAFAQAEEAGAQLNASMLQAGGNVSGNFQAITALAEKLGNKLPGTTADLMGMMTMLIREGASEQAILNGLGEATALLAVQLKMPYDAAAELSAKLSQATQTSEKDMLSLMDTIQKTFQLGVDPDDMLQGFSKLTPALSMLKQSGIQAANALAPLIQMAVKGGLRGEAAGNALRKVFQLSMDVKKVTEANGMMASRGIALDFTNGKGEFGGLNQLFAQLNKLNALTTAQRLAVLKKIFGDDAETLQVLAIMGEKGLKGYNEVIKNMNVQASLQERVNSILNTLAAKWEAAKGTFENMLAAFGNVISPELKATADRLGTLSEKVEVWVQVNPRFVRSVIAISGVLTGLRLAALAASIALGVLGTVFKMSPLGWIINIGAALLIANWEKVGPFFESLWERLQKGWQSIKDDWTMGIAKLGDTWQDTKDAIFGVWDAMVQKWQDIKSAFSWIEIANFGQTWQETKDIVFDVWDSMVRRWLDIKSVFSWENIKNGTLGMLGFSSEGGGGSELPASIDDIANLAGQAKGVDPALIKAIIGAESHGNPNLTSPKGAMGLMQLMPATAKRFGVDNAYDARQNAMGGAAYLSYLLRHYGGDEAKAIAAYNAGENAVDKYGGVPPYSETQAYTKKVLESLRRQRMGGSLDININGAPKGTRVVPKPGENLSMNTRVGYRSLGNAYG